MGMRQGFNKATRDVKLRRIVRLGGPGSLRVKANGLDTWWGPGLLNRCGDKGQEMEAWSLSPCWEGGLWLVVLVGNTEAGV